MSGNQAGQHFRKFSLSEHSLSVERCSLSANRVNPNVRLARLDTPRMFAYQWHMSSDPVQYCILFLNSAKPGADNIHINDYVWEIVINRRLKHVELARVLGSLVISLSHSSPRLE